MDKTTEGLVDTGRFQTHQVVPTKQQQQPKALKTTPLPGRPVTGKGLPIARHFTDALHARKVKPLDALEYVQSTSKIKDTDGRTVFEMKNVEVPSGWSQLAVD